MCPWEGKAARPRASRQSHGREAVEAVGPFGVAERKPVGRSQRLDQARAGIPTRSACIAGEGAQWDLVCLALNTKRRHALLAS